MEFLEFIDSKLVYAIIGVSENRDKWGRMLYEKLKEPGFKVIPVNPKHKFINSEPCYPNLLEIQEKIDVVITVVSPDITSRVIDEMIKLGIQKIWMQPGSESDGAIQLCKDKNIQYIANACMVVDGLKTQW